MNITKSEQLGSLQFRSSLTNIIKNLKSVGNDLAKLNEVKVDSYRLFLQCVAYDINFHGLQGVLYELQGVQSTGIKLFIQKLTEIQQNLNPFKEHQRALSIVMQAMSGKEKDIGQKFVTLKDDEKSSADKKAYTLLLAQLKLLIPFLDSSAKSSLSPYIEKLILIFTKELGVNPNLETKTVEEKHAIGTIAKLKSQIEEINLIFTAMGQEKEEEEIKDMSSIFSDIQKYNNTVVGEQKNESDLEADLSFCPTLCRFLQHNFDLKNLKLTTNLLHDLLILFEKDESALTNPLNRISFLHTMLVLGESTKDFSFVMQEKEKNVPWFLLRAIRNRIFHVLIDESEGRNALWEFLAGNSKTLSNKLFNSCIIELKELKKILDLMFINEQQIISWDIYPVYPEKDKNEGQSSALKDTIRSLVKEEKRKSEQEISSQELSQKKLFPALFFLADTLIELDKKARETRLLSESQSEDQRIITKALQEINAIEQFSQLLIISEKQLILNPTSSPIEVSFEKSYLTPICSIGTAYCGGLIKLLKDSCIPFERIAPLLLLNECEEIIFLRGELAHAVAAKDSSIELNTMLSINKNIVPLLQMSACRLMLANLSPLIEFKSELESVFRQFKNSACSGRFNILQTEALSLDRLDNFKPKDMKRLRDIIKATDFYKTSDFSDINKIQFELQTLADKCVKHYHNLLEDLKKINFYYKQLSKSMSQLSGEHLEVAKLELITIENEISRLESAVKEQQSLMEKIVNEEQLINKYLKEIDNKISNPPKIDEISSIIYKKYDIEVNLIKNIQISLDKIADRKDQCQIFVKDIEELHKKLDRTFNSRLKEFFTEEKDKIQTIDPNKIIEEIKELSGKNDENFDLFFANLSNYIKTCNQDIEQLNANYQKFSEVYIELIKIMRLFKKQNDERKDKKNTNEGAIGELFSSEIDQLKGELENRFKAIEKKMLELNERVKQLNELHLSLLELKAFAEPQKDKKHDDEPDVSINNVHIPQIHYLYHSPSKKFSDVHSLISEEDFEQFDFEESKTNDSIELELLKHHLYPLVKAELLEKILIKYNMLSEQEIKNLSNPYMQVAILFGEFKADFVRKLSDEQVQKIAVVSGLKRYEVVRYIAREIYSPKKVENTDVQTPEQPSSTNLNKIELKK